MKRRILALVTLALVGLGGPAAAYDAELARKADALLSKMDQKALAGSACKISAEALLQAMRNGEKVTLLDVRTPAEARVVAMTYPGTLQIPLDRLFQPESLDRLPADGKLVVVCHSGNRAAAAAVMLRAAKVDNAVFLNGGLIALTQATTPASAP